MRNAEKLIHSVRNKPFLYKKSSVYKTFGNVEGKSRSWLEVAREVYGRTDKVTVKRVKLQWKSLRDAFVKQQRKRQSATGVIRPYVYESEMEFLRPHILCRERDEPPPEEATLSLIPCKERDEPPPEEAPLSLEVKEEDCSSVSEESQPEQDTVFPEEEYVEDTKTVQTKNEVRYDNDTHPVDAFFHGVAQTVKHLRPTTIARLKKAVANLVMDAEIEELENKERAFSIKS